MKQIYNFEQHKPPVLNKNMLRAELERRRLRWQTALIAVAGILLQVVVVLVGLLVMNDYPMLTMLCLGYTVVSVTGGSILAILVTRKGGISYAVDGC